MQNRTRAKHLALALATLLVAAGCTTTPGGWAYLEGEQRADEIALSADVPKGWSRWQSNKDITLTKDGLLLQMILINRTEYGAPYENTDLTIQPGMTPLDASQIIVEDMQANQKLRNIEILNNRPATVAGYDGLRIEVTYKNDDNLKVHEIVYVALAPDSYVVARCRAPDRHYIEIVSGDFERVVASIKLDGPSAPEENPG